MLFERISAAPSSAATRKNIDLQIDLSCFGFVISPDMTHPAAHFEKPGNGPKCSFDVAIKIPSYKRVRKVIL